jgi:hypothetical protein
MTKLTLVLAAAALTQSAPLAQEPSRAPVRSSEDHHILQQHPYLGMWVTGDGVIRQELLPNGRYDEARGTRRSAYQGRYQVTGNMIYYWDDTGFTADGEFVSDDELHHGGMIFFRQD